MSGLTHVLKAAVVSALLIVIAATPASAVTIRDLLNLKNAGLSDDILIALMESDGSVFYLTADEVISLRRQGLSERVLLAMIETGKKLQQQQPPAVAPDMALESPVYEQIAQPPLTLQVSQVNEQYVEQPQSRYADYPMTYPYAYPFGYPIAVPVCSSAPWTAYMGKTSAAENLSIGASAVNVAPTHGARGPQRRGRRRRLLRARNADGRPQHSQL